MKTGLRSRLLIFMRFSSGIMAGIGDFTNLKVL